MNPRLVARLLVASLLLSFAVPLLAAGSPREHAPFNNDWRFIKGDPEGAGDALSYAKIWNYLLPSGNAFRLDDKPSRPEGNPGENVAYTQAGYDDSKWRKLTLPHDWGIEGPFSQDLPGETGKLPWSGVGWYRKHFQLSTNDSTRHISIEVDGAMAYATVWLNGQFVGGWPYGYASWQLDLTPYLKFGGDNILAIRLDNPPESSRWYPGGGIYRNVWLTKTAPVRIAQWGTFVTTLQADASEATVAALVNLENTSSNDTEVDVESAFYELDAKGNKGRELSSGLGTDGIKLPAGTTVGNDGKLTIEKPRLWSTTKPQRYVMVTSVKQGGKVIDTYETPFGIRTIQFTATNGFLLNGERVQIQGVCDHHDLGALGSAFNTRAAQRQLEILQAMGCNAIRTSHNPPAPELLDLCDRMGFLVMDEAFDAWTAKKKQNDYHLIFEDWHVPDLRALLLRDRNHPSVILWSIGNEVPEQGNTNRIALAQELADIVRGEDPTRPVTMACNEQASGFNGYQNTVDVFGYNYRPYLYAKFRDSHPDQPLFGSETASTVSSRGEYFFPVYTARTAGRADFQVSSYDWYTPEWANIPDVEFAGQQTNSSVAGEFVWTGFDYLGEPTPYGGDTKTKPLFTDTNLQERAEAQLKDNGKILVPSRSSYFGIIDLAGFPKDRYYLYQSRWRPDFPMAHIVPHWTWPERKDQVTPIYVYTSGDEAELFLNGASLGGKKKQPGEYRLRWDDVKYEPGALTVVAYKNGKHWANDTVRTAGPAARLKVTPDRPGIVGDKKDLCYVTVAINDKSGQLVPRAQNLVQFKLTGPGEIVAVDNGDPTSFEPFQATQHKAFNGLALCIVRATGPGKIKLTAKADGLPPATTTISATK